MVFTIEPGVYLPGAIGIRIEDTVVLEGGGARRLTDAPRDLLVL
jgi:Xaa-Pro aminopeptidase